MARQVGFSVENNFSKGLITEASGLTFPENACTATYDCIHELTGNVRRRKGFEFEINHSVKEIDRTEGVVVSYLWRDVAGDGTLSLVVLQVKNSLYFYEANTTDPLSGHAVSAFVDLTDFSPSGAPDPDTQECQFTSGGGKLFVSHPYLESFSVAYNPNDQTVTATQIDIEIRDFEGIVDNLEVSERPTTGLGGLTIPHYYNLLNQGWNVDNLTSWDAARTDMPSNSDVMWTFKNSSDVFDTATVPNVIQGNSPAPKGHFVLNLFDQDRQTPTGLSISNQTTGYQRASTIAFFAGRLFYSGINYVGYNSKIFFSQIIERDEQFGKAYQANDPTAETLFDLLPTDGGVIVIQEAGTIIKMISVPGGLVVFASNGIWLISGSTGIGFSATDYTVTKISSITSLTHTSFVDLAGAPVWWNLEGIYRLDSQGQGFQVTPLTENTIKTFYRDIPPSEKRNVRGFFNPIAGIIQWLYRSTESGDLEEYYNFDRVLSMNINTGGFYLWTIPEHDIKIHGLVVLENRGGSVSLEDVTDNLGNVLTDISLDPMQIWTIGNSIVTPSFKYIISYDDSGDQFTFAEVRNENYVDWELYGEESDYTSYFVTGYRVRGDAIRDFQTNYVNTYSDNNSKYYLQGIYDYTNTGNSGRWSNPQIIDTQDDTDADYVSKRRKIRGHGKALQIKVSSISGEPFNVVGWSTMVSANQQP